MLFRLRKWTVILLVLVAGRSLACDLENAAGTHSHEAASIGHHGRATEAQFPSAPCHGPQTEKGQTSHPSLQCCEDQHAALQSRPAAGADPQALFLRPDHGASHPLDTPLRFHHFRYGFSRAGPVALYRLHSAWLH